MTTSYLSVHGIRSCRVTSLVNFPVCDLSSDGSLEDTSCAPPRHRRAWQQGTVNPLQERRPITVSNRSCMGVVAAVSLMIACPLHLSNRHNPTQITSTHDITNMQIKPQRQGPYVYHLSVSNPASAILYHQRSRSLHRPSLHIPSHQSSYISISPSAPLEAACSFPEQ